MPKDLYLRAKAWILLDSIFNVSTDFLRRAGEHRKNL
jgi:hypothetical protein